MKLYCIILCEVTGLHGQAQRVPMDFERATVNAVEARFTRSRLIGYWFQCATTSEHSCREPEVGVKFCMSNFSKLVYCKVVT